MGAPKMLVERWKNFLTEEEYSDEELDDDPLWNDLSRGDIDGFFWGVADGTLDSYTNHIYDLAHAIDFPLSFSLGVPNASQFKRIRDMAMEYRSINDAFKELVPGKEEEDSSLDALTDPGSARASQRQSDRKEKKTESLIDNLIDDIIQSLGGNYSPDEILNKIQARAGERKDDKEI